MSQYGSSNSSDLPLTCQAAQQCSSDLLLDPRGITLAGSEDLHYRLGELLVSGSDVAEATALSWPMGDDREDGDDWAIGVYLTKEATSSSLKRLSRRSRTAHSFFPACQSARRTT